ncbi:MAG TPA: hypothetical protein VF461_06560 [Gemmatimonadaceae bacterium]
MLLAQLARADTASPLARLVEPWNGLYSDSKAVATTVMFFHLVPLLIAGGAALTADRATIRVSRASLEVRAQQLGELARTHFIVLVGLALSFISGILLFLSDVDEFLGSPWFWVKLGFVGLLLANGFVMTRTERALANGGDQAVLWSRLRTISLFSLTLWIATTLVGVALTNYA